MLNEDTSISLISILESDRSFTLRFRVLGV